MRKEVVIAIVLGFALGLIITFGIWSANRALKQKEVTPVTEEVSPSLTPTPAPSFSLAILSPEDESLATTEKITLSGTTEPEADIVVISEKGEEILSADSTGKFETEITLENGTNEITVTAANSEDEEATKTIHVVYSTAE